VRLPVPNAEEVGRFKALCRRRLKVTLSDDEALDAATRLVQLACLMNAEIYPLRQEEQ
jgi:hypothetical protein